jgi:nitroimidazol reductase NimA-like FMN-containing flavoprotein (pyridoxamine 5'-phosphate oxidase superfamily)/ribosomal protein S18 acetylase RimI-like enzyme
MDQTRRRLSGMRREIFRSPPGRALALLRRAPVVHLATTTPEGEPVLRALDGAVLDDGVYFHGARAGEKARCLGRPAVVSAEEVVAHVPSWMVDPRWACPASTLYRSVQVHGLVAEVTDPAVKAGVLSALMQRWQPEGRHQPIDPGHPHYRGQLEGTLVLRVGFDRVDGKEKLLQNRTPSEVGRVIEGLWQRGQPGDPAAIEAVREANPAAPTPAFLAAPEGLRLAVALREGDAGQAERLLAKEYWWDGAGLPPGLIRSAQHAAHAWVGAHDAEGRLVAMARAVSDGRNAWIYDVVVEGSLRRGGLGRQIMKLLLDHPALRGTPFVRLSTRDAQGFYERLGFEVAGPSRRWPTTSDMLLRRSEPAAAPASRGAA